MYEDKNNLVSHKPIKSYITLIKQAVNIISMLDSDVYHAVSGTWASIMAPPQFLWVVLSQDHITNLRPAIGP